MATQVLSNSDFSVKSSNAVLTDSGSIYIKTEKNNDYTTAIVSNDVFNLSANKSLVIKFKADPYVEVKFLNRIWANNDRNIFVNNNNKVVVDSNEQDIEINGDYVVDGSDTNTGILMSNHLYLFGEDNNQQISDATTDNIIDFAIGSGFIAVIRINDDGKNIVEVYGKDANDTVAVPDDINSYDSKEDAPVKIVAGNNFIVLVTASGKIKHWGESKILANLNNDLTYTNVIANDNSIFLRDTKNNAHFYMYSSDSDSVEELTISDVQYGYVFNNNILFTALNGDTYYCDFGDNKVKMDIKYPVNYIVSNDSKKIICTLNSSTPVNDYGFDVKQYIPQETDNSDFNMYPNLSRNDAFNMFFGFQNNTLPADTSFYVNKAGESTPIVVSTPETNSNFGFVSKFCKGFILTKHSGGVDLLYNVKTKPKKDFLIDGFTTIPDEFVTYEDNIYKLVVSFTPFGKSFRIFKEINGNEYEITSHFVSLEEYPFELGRIAIYGKGVSNFELIETMITDELDTTLLPEEILYRDLDMNVLQTKVAESMNKHSLALKSINENVQKLSNLIKKATDVYSSKFEDIEDRLSNLEDN